MLREVERVSKRGRQPCIREGAYDAVPPHYSRDGSNPLRLGESARGCDVVDPANRAFVTDGECDCGCDVLDVAATETPASMRLAQHDRRSAVVHRADVASKPVLPVSRAVGRWKPKDRRRQLGISQGS